MDAIENANGARAERAMPDGASGINRGIAGTCLRALAALLIGASARAGETKRVEVNGRVLELANGFEIETVAARPLIERPICADFDERGRLYVAEAAGDSDTFDEHIRNKSHRVIRLEDTNGDGRFDRKAVFADRLMIPQGSMWLAGSLYVAAPPVIWKFTDTDDDGVADQRIEWFRGKDAETHGCANDVRGPYIGPDGWIYWCKGGLLPLTVERPGQAPFSTSANHVFRRRPDGTGFEPVMIGGMDNPVEVAFTRGGEPLFTTTQFQVPGTPRTDGLFHAVHGGVYPKDLAEVHEFPWTAPNLLPVLTHWGASAPAGLLRYESAALGPDVKDNVFVAHFNYHKVTRHALTESGATFRSTDSDLLSSADVNFHPTDVLEDADGSLLVIETGGWYRFCCPSSSLFKPEVLGAIYRVRRSGMPAVLDARGQSIAWATQSNDDLVRLLGDRRPAVRRRAISLLAAGGRAAVPALAQELDSANSGDAHLGAVWALARIDDPDARLATRKALADRDAAVCQAAIRSVCVWRDRDALPALVELLGAPSTHNRRAAAEALGRIGETKAVPALLAALETPADRFLDHAFIFALIEIADRTATLKGLNSASTNVRRAALTVLDQTKGGAPPVEAVTRELASPNSKLKETAWWIAERHSSWDAELVQPLRNQLLVVGSTPAAADRELLAERLGRFAGRPAIRDWLGTQLDDSATGDEPRRVILRAMALAGLKDTPGAWIAAVARALASRSASIKREAVATARAWHLSRSGHDALAAALRAIANDPRNDDNLRLQALSAIPNGLEQVAPATLAYVLSQLDLERPVDNRSIAVEVVGQARLTSAQLVELAGRLKNVGPLELSRLLGAFNRSTDTRVGSSLVTALAASKARASLRVAVLKPIFERYGPAVAERARSLYQAIESDTLDRRAKLHELAAVLQARQGDIRRGHELFHSQKTACASCHAIAYVGGTVGPALTQIGRLRSEGDLLESIVFPSATLAQGYEGTTVATTDGRSVSGVIVKNAPDAIVLAVGPAQEVRLARAEIEAMKPSMASIMPEGLAQQLTPQELADLLVFLKSCQ
jgi:putative membrane-bound dehydrogenase-like protein